MFRFTCIQVLKWVYYVICIDFTACITLKMLQTSTVTDLIMQIRFKAYQLLHLSFDFRPANAIALYVVKTAEMLKSTCLLYTCKVNSQISTFTLSAKCSWQLYISSVSLNITKFSRKKRFSTSLSGVLASASSTTPRFSASAICFFRASLVDFSIFWISSGDKSYQWSIQQNVSLQAIQFQVSSQ